MEASKLRQKAEDLVKDNKMLIASSALEELVETGGWRWDLIEQREPDSPGAELGARQRVWRRSDVCLFSPPAVAGPEHSSALAAPGSAQPDTGTRKSPSVSGESGAEKRGGAAGAVPLPDGADHAAPIAGLLIRV